MKFHYNKIIKYYRTFKPELPSNPERRIFKGKDEDGNWRVNKKTIRTEKHLKNFIIKNKLVDVYYTKNLFLNPRRLLKGVSMTDKLKIKEYLVIDIDEDFSIEGLERARQHALKVVELIKLPIKKICFTGSKGFRIEFKINKDQIEEIKQNRKLFKLKKQYKLSIDTHLNEDEFVIIRLPYSVNSKSGLLCCPLTHKELKQPLNKILSKVNIFNVKIPLKQTAKEKKEGKSPGKEKGMFSQITNRTGKRFVVFIKHRVLRKRLLKKIQLKYDLGPMYLFKQGDFFYWVSQTTYQKRRLQKILRASQSLNLREFKKFGKNFFMMVPEPQYIVCIQAETNSFVSREHLKIMAMFENVEFNKKRLHKPRTLEIITGKNE